MGESRGETRLERGPAADLWRHTLSQIPTTFGRLVYLASLRSPNSGNYEHFGLAQAFGSRIADRTLKQSHMQVFTEWLSFNLEQQKDDLEEYLTGLEDDFNSVLSNWIRLSPYRNLVPNAAREVEKKLYLLDLETVLELLRNEHAVASPDPDA